MSLCDIHGCLEPATCSVALDLDAHLTQTGPIESHLGVTFAACPHHAAYFDGCEPGYDYRWAVRWVTDE